MDVGFGKVLSVNNDGDVLFYEYLDASKKTWDKSDIFIKMKKEKGWPTYDKDYIDFVRNAAFVRVKKYSFHVSGRNKHQDGKTTTLFVLPLKNVSHIEGKIDNNRNDTTIKFIISSKNSVGDTINKYVEIDNKKVKLIKVETIKVEKEMSQAEYEKTVNAINGVK